jgi:hypothetical protein
MITKKIWATLACVLILVSLVLAGPSSSPAYAQPKTHLGVSPADMVILTSDNQSLGDNLFKRIYPNGDKIDFEVPTGKVLIITDISISYSGEGVLSSFRFHIWDVINWEMLIESQVYDYTLTELRGHKFAFTSGLTFYPSHKVAWGYSGVFVNHGLIRVYLYGYLTDAPPLPRLRRPDVGPPLPPQVD